MATALLVSLAPATTSAQTLGGGPEGASAVHRLHAGNGLPHNTVYDLHFDREGWLWVATAAGLFRHDGVAFLPYRSAVARHSETHDLQEAPNGQIYVQNFRQQIFRVREDSLELAIDLGINAYDLSTYSLMEEGVAVLLRGELSFVPYGRLPQREPKGLSPIEYSSEAKALLAHGRTLGLILNGLGEPEATFSGSTLQRVRKDRAGKVLLLHESTGGSFVLRQAEEVLSWQRMRVNGFETVWSGPTPIPSVVFRAYAKTEDGREYYGGSGGVFARSSSGEWTEVLPQTDVSALAVDNCGRLWVATLDQGLFALPAHQVVHTVYPRIANSLHILRVLRNGERYGATRNGQLYALTDTGSRLLAAESDLVAL